MRFFVYYRKNPTFRRNDSLDNLVIKDYSGLQGTIIQTDEYVFVGTQFAIDKDVVFRRMQGEMWSPHGEARNLIKALGLSHTSMSVGDVLIGENGNAYECSNAGWREI